MSNVKKMMGCSLLAGMMLVGPATVHATEVTIGADVVSAYVWRGITLNSDAVIQPSLAVEHDSGFAVEVWANFDLGDNDGEFAERQFSEIDFDISYTLDLDVAYVTLGYIEYTFPGDGAFVFDDDGEIDGTVAAADRDMYLSLGTEFEGLEVDLTIYQSVLASDGTYIVLSAGYGIEVVDGITVGLNGSVAWGSKGATDMGKAGFHDYLVGATLDYEVFDGLDVGLFVNYVGTLDKDVLSKDSIEEDFFGGVGMYYTF